MFPLKDNIPTTTFPIVTVALLVINVLAYFLWQKGGILNGPSDANVVDYGWIPYEIKHPGQQCIAQGNVHPAGRERSLHPPHQRRKESSASSAPGIVPEANLLRVQLADAARIAARPAGIFDRRRRWREVDAANLLDRALVAG